MAGFRWGDDPLEFLNKNQDGPNPEEYRWSTYSRRRTPSLKRHRVVGHAKNALFGMFYDITNKAFELRDGAWVDVTQEWREARAAKIEAGRQAVEAKRKSCAHPCKHCSLQET